MTTNWYIEQPAITAFSFIASILSAIPLVWMSGTWNIGGILYIFWVSTLNLFQAINMVVWRNSAVDFTPGWCDLYVRYRYMGNLGLITAGLVIARRTCLITTGMVVFKSEAERRRDVLVDLAIGLVLPIIQLPIFWVVQGHRFDIFEGLGCLQAVPCTILAITLYSIWPIIIGLISASYCIRTLRSFFRRRRENNSILSQLSPSSGLTLAKYYRLLILCSGEMLCTVPLGTYILARDITTAYYPFIGMADLHSGFDRVDQYPIALWLPDPDLKFTMEWTSWIVPALGLYFFCLFGLSSEAIRNYRSAVRWVTKKTKKGFRTLGRYPDQGDTTTRASDDVEWNSQQFAQKQSSTQRSGIATSSASVPDVPLYGSSTLQHTFDFSKQSSQKGESTVGEVIELELSRRDDRDSLDSPVGGDPAGFHELVASHKVTSDIGGLV